MSYPSQVQYQTSEVPNNAWKFQACFYRFSTFTFNYKCEIHETRILKIDL